MSDENHEGGALDQNAGGAGSDKGQKDSVAYDTYKKVMDEVKALKSTLKEQKSIIDGYMSKEEELEKSKLVEQGKYKEILEKNEGKIATLEETNLKLAKRLEENAVFSVVKDHLKKAGCTRDDLIPLAMQKVEREYRDKLIIDKETLEIDKTSLESYVENFKKETPSLFLEDKKTPSDAGHGGRKETKDFQSQAMKAFGF